jgi:hypothetical protein
MWLDRNVLVRTVLLEVALAMGGCGGGDEAVGTGGAAGSDAGIDGQADVSGGDTSAEAADRDQAAGSGGGDASTDASDGAGDAKDGSTDANDGPIDALTDTNDGDTSAAGCVDIHVTHAILPDPAKWSTGGPGIGMYADRDHLWRDATGIHVAWNPQYATGSGEMVVSSFDPATGALLGNRFFPQGGRKGVVAAGVAPDGTVGLGVGYQAPDASTATYALLLMRTDDAIKEQIVAISSWPLSTTVLVGVGWDGQAFAVHGFGADGTQYVTRIAPDGTVLLAPVAFGREVGYPVEVRYVTDAVSGVSFAVTGSALVTFPWLAGHTRDGAPLPDPTKIQATQLQPQNFPNDGTWAAGTTRATIAIVPGGAAVAWSHNPPQPATVMTTFIQPLGAGLTPAQDVIGIAGEVFPGTTVRDSNEWLTVQRTATGWWLAGSNTETISEYNVVGNAPATRRPLVTYSRNGWRFAVSDMESAGWGDEIWLGFYDQSGPGAQPYRVVRAKPGCTYRSDYDMKNGP